MKDPEIFLDHANALEYSRLFLSATDYFKVSREVVCAAKIVIRELIFHI